MFFGIIIAEPLVLRIFSTAVEQHIKDQRDDELEAIRSRILACNPLPGEPASPATVDCYGYAISFASSPRAAIGELVSLRGDAETLEASIARYSAELGKLQEVVSQECTGVPSSVTTGKVGEGPECRRRQQFVDKFLETHPIAADSQRLTDLRARIKFLEGQVAGDTRTFEQQRDDAVRQRVDDWKQHQGDIGLLERFSALSELISANTFLFWARWLIAVFFILLDCLPILVKFFNGATSYDRLVDTRLESTDRVYRVATRTMERVVTEDLEVQHYEAESSARRRKAEIDQDGRKHAASLSAELDREIDSLAAELLRQSRHRPQQDAPRYSAPPLRRGETMPRVDGLPGK